MKCPECEYENRDKAESCEGCGIEIKRICWSCGKTNAIRSIYCDKCGTLLIQDVQTGNERNESSENYPHTSEVLIVYKSKKGERKFVSVLFSDLSDYTSVSKKQDPEDVKELMSRIFGEITRVIYKYDGFIEKFIGDAVMAIFGATQAHEDDPIRAILAAREIHDVIPRINSEIQNPINHPLAMHTGISTGLVVTGEADHSSGTHGFIGNTIINASRLCSFADSGNIIVDPDTYVRSGGFFNYKQIEFISKKDEVEFKFVYQVLSTKKNPKKTLRFQGLKADLIGREEELEELNKAVERLKDGSGSMFSLKGNAGTGKSRLVEEFRDSSVLGDIQWFEGHAYSYSQNMPYSLLIDILNRFFKIKEDDPPNKVRENIRQYIEDLIDEADDVIRYIDRLYFMNQPNDGDMDPEFWKSHIKTAVFTLFSHIAEKAPTVFCFEDLHWADPSSMNLLYYILARFDSPALLLCVYRPSFSLFAGQFSDFKTADIPHYEIELHDLLPVQTEKMVMSLLKTESIPSDLKEYIEKSVGRNPFYLEEAINSLIESGNLVFEITEWRLVRILDEIIMPASIQGIISARLDRLGSDTKHIVQEASVIGRTFRHEILSKITSEKSSIDSHLEHLERIGLIRIRLLNNEPIYIFKHILTQEAIYNGLLKSDRREIHRCIARVLEENYADRLGEYYETLAYHYKHGESEKETILYLTLSGEKSLEHHSLDAAHKYFMEAYNYLINSSDDKKDQFILDLILRWSMIFHHRGDFKGMERLLRTHQEMAESSGDYEKLGEFYMWLGQALHLRLKTNESYRYLIKSVKLGEKYNEIRVIAWAAAYLPSVCSFLGMPEEVDRYKEIALKVCMMIESDHFLHIQTMASIGFACWAKGDCKNALETGSALLEFGKEKSNTRSIAIGYLNIGHSYLTAGDFLSAYTNYQLSVDTSADPFHFSLASVMLGICLLLEKRTEKAEEIFKKVLDFSIGHGLEAVDYTAYLHLGAALISNGEMTRGMKLVKRAHEKFVKEDLKFFIALSSYILGKLHLEFVLKNEPVPTLVIIKNIPFLLKNLPFASRKAERYLTRAIEIAEEIEAYGILGQAYLDMGLLKQKKRKTALAKDFLRKSIDTFEICSANFFQKIAEDALAEL